jgi:hypothetical protein
MPNEEHLALINQGVDAWNRWRKEHADTLPDLTRANLTEANLSGADLSNVNLREAKLIGADLSRANLTGADLEVADLEGADLGGAKLGVAFLGGAYLARAIVGEAYLGGAYLGAVDLSGAYLGGADLSGANLTEADLGGANLAGADLTGAILVETNLENAILNGCRIYGTSAWNLMGVPRDQVDLIITPHDEPIVTVDNLEIAQFIYLLLNNQNVREVIDAITSKVVLILGRFTEERKRVLDAIREELRRNNLTPILFDFDKPASKDITGTVETLARMARFIIADLTDPSSIPHELATIVPFLRTTPVLPIMLVGSNGYSMFEDLRSYNWVLDIHEYTDGDSLISNLPKVIAPADRMAEELRRAR